MRELVERRKDRHWRVYDTEQYTVVKGQTKKLYRATYQKGQNYKNLLTGKWEDYDGNWEHDDTADPRGNQFGWKVKKSDAQLRIFAQNPNKKWMRIGFAPGVFVQYSIPNVEPSYIGNTALFVDAWSNTDMRLTASPEGVKNDVILKAPGHPASFSFPISVTGCSAQVEGNTLVYYRDSEPIARIPAPYMEDANSERGAVALSFDGKAVTFTPDAEWLQSAVYPVTIDPTTTLQPDGAAGKDAYVRTDIPDINTGNINVGMYGPYLVTSWARFFLQFDLSFIVSGSIINSATFELFQASAQSAGTHRFEVRAVTSVWDELTIKWYSQPSLESSAYDAHILSTSATWVSWSIKDLVQRWVNGEIPNNGLCVVYSDAHPGTSAHHFAYSSDHSTASYRPKLTIDYTEGSTGTDIIKVVTDAMGISETMLKNRGRLRVFTHLLSVTDTAAKARARVKIVSNQIDVAENRIRLRDMVRVVTEALRMAETAGKIRGRFKVISDAIGLIESIIKDLVRRILKYAPNYTWTEISERYSAMELQERYQATEIPSRYTWKELG